ncbi:hypothetical protein [Paenibacillus medicaginis]|uniref:ISAzo13 family transposase n=1 Tax=Paenibacillus medicaginis TaxID=1470560 RepID=A0ABV5C241_9BACL
MDSPLKQRYDQLSPYLNERQKRLFVATEALVYGCGGIAWIERELGISHKVIQAGTRDLQDPEPLDSARIRKPDTDPPLRWTFKGTRKLAEALRDMGHATSSCSPFTL